MLGTAEWWLGVDDPVLVEALSEKLAKETRLSAPTGRKKRLEEAIHLEPSGARPPVRRHMLADTSMFRGLRHGLPDNLLCDGNVGPPVVDGAGKQICLRLHPAPILAQGV